MLFVCTTSQDDGIMYNLGKNVATKNNRGKDLTPFNTYITEKQEPFFFPCGNSSKAFRKLTFSETFVRNDTLVTYPVTTREPQNIELPLAIYHIKVQNFLLIFEIYYVGINE